MLQYRWGKAVCSGGGGGGGVRGSLVGISFHSAGSFTIQSIGFIYVLVI
jgi:hypothetical protein